MKKELSALETGYLVKEFQELIDSKVDSIIHPEKHELIIQFFVPSKGKKLLRIMPNFIYFTSEKKSIEKPSGFCMNLRKNLANARLREIKQKESERIIEFLFETKEGQFILIVELFSKGNIILCDKNYTILSLTEAHKWKDRELKPKLKYIVPPSRINFFELNDKNLKKALESDKPLVKKLASDIGLGGVYSEEVCLLADLDKNKTKIDDKEIEQIAKTIKTITNKKIEANVVYENDKILDIVPFSLELYKSFKVSKFETYNHALDSVLATLLKSAAEDEKSAAYSKKIEKIEKVIEKQEESAKAIEEGIVENEKKAELIYGNYNLIKEIVDTIKEATKKYSWKEIDDKLKNHKVVKEVNSKDKKVVLELK